jgi:DNA-binding GntR family transcriptional regulator
MSAYQKVYLAAAMQTQVQGAQARKSESLYEVIYSVLRDHLRRGVLIDGLVLGEANVARAFQTSRVPASAALKLLCDEGLISGFGGRGYLVRSGRGSPPAAQRLDLLKAGLELPPQFSGPRRTRNRGNQIYREVEHSVAACLAYGRFMLNESALAEYYGVSRTIAHEVLVKLELAGIAVHDRNQRWYAGPLTADELANRFQVRWMLEPEALRQSFPHLTKSELTRRRDRAYRARKGNVAPPERERIERDLHQETLAHCDNKVLFDTILRAHRPLIPTHSAFVSYQRTAELMKMAAEHIQIYDALLEGSPESAAAALEGHLRRSLQPNLDLMSRLEPLSSEHRPAYLFPIRYPRPPES